MKKKVLYVDFNVIQTVPPSCVNRDDTGSPKTAVYGGAVRARVSSQSWKRAVRSMFKEIFPSEQTGYRTKKILSLVEEKIRQLNPDVNAEKLARKALENVGFKFKSKKGQAEEGRDTDVLFFISEAQIKALAQLALDEGADKKEFKKALTENPSVDLALFGRMVASDASLNFDACCQVAHAISTHAVHAEYDYFTAVDDCAPEDNAGAGHIGTKEFDSATLYRYATINVEELRRLLGSATSHAVAGFAEAFIRSMPTGSQNTFANRTLPDAVYVTIRDDQPVNLCGAFENPVKASEGYVKASKRAICDYAKNVYHDYAGEPVKSFCVGKDMEELAEPMTLKQLLEELESLVAEYCSEEV